MDRFIKGLIKERAIVLFLMVLVSAYGLYSYYIIPKQENPNTTVAAAAITTIYPGASPEEVEKLVTDKIEEELKTIENIDYFTSMSMNSASAIVVMYNLDVKIEDVETTLRQKIADVQNSLPDMCQPSQVRTDLISNNQFIISLSSDTYSRSELAEYAKTIKSSLENVKDVASVKVEGEASRRVVVEADIDQLRQYGISIENILQLMQAQNLSIPAGSINYDSGTVNVSASGVFENLRDIENTVVGGAESSLSFVKLKDVAKVYIEDVEDFYYKQDSRDAILLTGTFAKGKNAVIIGNNLRKTLDEIKSQVPPEINFHEVMYAPTDISASINNFIVNLIESIILIVIVVMIGVQLTNGLVISVALPLSVFITFIVMNVMKLEFQFISIAALIVSLGILVDNAIVISEAIQQNLNEDMERLDAVINAVKVTAMPVFTSTLTTVVTFSIIYFVPGAVGQVAAAIPTVVIAALSASYFVSMCVIPILGYMFFKPEKRDKGERLVIVKKFFDKLLNMGMNHKKGTLVAAFATLFVSAALALQLGLQFFPTSAKPVIYINVSGETLSLKNTGEIVNDVGQVLTDSPLVDNYTCAVGTGMPSFFLTVPTMNTATNAAQFMLQLNPEELKKVGTTDQAARQIQALIDKSVAGATIEVKCLEYSMPIDAKITLTVTGDDTNTINKAVEEISTALRGIEGTDNVRNTVVVPQYQYKVNLDSEVLSTYGLLKYDVVKQLNTSLMGATASSYTAAGSDMDIVVKADVESLDDLYNLPISGSVANTKVLLGQIADIEIDTSVPLIRHYNGSQYANVLANVMPGYSSSKIESTLNKDYLPNIDLSEVNIISRGEIKNMLDLVVSLGISAIFAILIIYIILLLQFNDFKKPLNIMTSIPLSLIGCCFGLWIFRMDIQVMALLGLVSLFGIVVNNGILLIEVIDAEIRAGKEVEAACRSAVDQRFRPIFLSSTTTCIGLVPLILANDPMTAPMASVLLFGLLFSTILTMVVVPTIYAMTAEKAQAKALKKALASQEKAENKETVQ